MSKTTTSRTNKPEPLGPPPAIVNDLILLAGELELKHRNGVPEEKINEAARIRLRALETNLLKEWEVWVSGASPKKAGTLDDVNGQLA